MDHDFKKQFGQNFLENFPKIIEICDIADIQEGENIIEIGPGDGAFTEEIINRKANLLAIEIDPSLVKYLREKFIQYKNFEIIENDILQIDPSTLNPKKQYKLISALPYNISKKIINQFLTSKNPPTTMTLIMQKEVAEDYANTKKGQIKFLHILGKTYSKDVEYFGAIRKEDFYPQPKVDGGVVKFSDIKAQIPNPEAFLKFVKLGFSAPRKKLSSNLSNIYKDKKDEIEKILAKLNLSKDSRAGELQFAEWYKLYKNFTNAR